MKDYDALEAEYLNLCDVVHKDGLRIFGLAGVGRSDDAAEAAAALAQKALTCRNQYKMQQEQTQEYDLQSLRVDLTEHRPE